MPPRGKHLHQATAEEFLAFVIAYSNLLLALWEARDCQLPRRTTAVPLSRFRDMGVPDRVLIWMLYQAHVEHFQQDASNHHGSPERGAAAGVLFTSTSSFALTELGEAFGAYFLDNTLVPEREAALQAAWNKLLLGELVPCYDKDNRVFSWGRNVLKCFRQPSVNQELVLRAAEELGWAVWFDDPLPGQRGKSAKVRLHDTIKDLNRRQVPHLIHFKGDGTGTRVGWEYR